MCGVLLFRGKGILSSLIRWQTRSRYAHAAIMLNGAYDRTGLLHAATIIESWPGVGVRQTTLHDFDGVDFFDAPLCGIFGWERVKNFAQKQIGAKYDYLGCARFVTRQKDWQNDPGNWFCSELVYAAFLNAGLPLLRTDEPWKVSPAMLGLSPFLKRTSVCTI